MADLRTQLAKARYNSMFRKKASDNFKKTPEWKAFRKLLEKFAEEGLIVIEKNRDFIWDSLSGSDLKTAGYKIRPVNRFSQTLIEVAKDEGVKIELQDNIYTITFVK